MKTPEIMVVSKEVAGDILTDPAFRYGLRWLISIGDETSSVPKGWDTVSPKKRLRLVFDDVVRESLWYTPINRDQVDKLVAFCEKAREGRALIHCAAGISRSTAAALVLLAVRLGPGREGEAVSELFRMTDELQQADLRDDPIRPNRRIVWMADEALGRNGALYNAFEALFEGTYRTPYEHEV